MSITGQELLNKVKKNKNTTGRELLDKINRASTTDYSMVNQAYIDSFMKDADNYVKTADADYGKVNWGNATSSYNTRNTAWNDLSKRADAVGAWLYHNRNTLSNDVYDNYNNYLDSIYESGQGIADAFKSNMDYYSQWATQEDYDAYYKDFQEKQKMANSVEGKAGWQKYLADQSTPKESIPWWQEAILRAHATSNDNPIAMAFNTAVYDYQRDESYRMPSDNWTDDERNIFGYYYATNPAQAYTYAVNLNNQKNLEQEQKKMAEIVQNATSNFGSGAVNSLGALFAATTGLADTLNYLAMQAANRPITEDGFVSPFEYSQAVQSGISNKLNEMGGTLNVGGMDIGLGNLYGIGMSIASSQLSGRAFGAVGTLVNFFGQGAAQGVKEAKQMGATDEQALLYGSLSGAFEGIAEMIGFDHLTSGLTSASTMKAALKNIIAQAGAEGLEEGWTSLANSAIDMWVLQDKGKILGKVNELMANGVSEADAKKQVLNETFGEALYDTITGAISGAVGGGIETGIKNHNINTQFKNEYIKDPDSLKSLLEGIALENPSVDTSKLMEKYRKGEKISANELRKFVYANEQSVWNQDKSKLVDSTEKRLSELGEKGDLRKLAESIVNAQYGYSFDDAILDSEQAILNNEGMSVKDLSYLMAEYSQNAQNKQSLSKADQKAIRNSEYGSRVSNELNPNMREETSSAWAQGVKTNRLGNTAGNVAKTRAVLTQLNEASKSRKKLPSDAISYKSGAVDASLTPKGRDAKIEGENKSVSETYARAEGYKGLANETFSKYYKGENIEEYALGFREAYDYGLNGTVKDVKELANHGSFKSYINEEAREMAFNAGVVDAKYMGIKSKTIKVDGDYKVTVPMSNKALSESKQATIELMKVLAPIAKVNMSTMVSIKDHGLYDSTTNTIYIDLSMDGRDVMIFTLAHELTHHLKRVNPEQFDEFARALFEEVGKTENIEERLAKWMRENKKYYPKMDQTKFKALAREEVVAEMCESFLTDEKVVQRISQKVYETDKGLWNTIKKWFADLVAKLKKLFADLDPQSENGRIVREMGDRLDSVRQMWADIVVEAGKVEKVASNTNPMHSFKGIKAQNNDITAFNRAQEMIANGMDSETVRQETGWFKGYDGKWRYEIDDSELAYYPDADAKGYSKDADVLRVRELFKKHQNGEATEDEFEEMRSLMNIVGYEKMFPTNLSDYVAHEKLFEAYPQLKDVRVSVLPLSENTNANYNLHTKTISINENIINDDTAVKNALIHEIQHAIQDIEGFANGASVEYWKEQRQDIVDTIAGARENLDLWLADIGYDDFVKSSMQEVVSGEKTLEQHWEDCKEFKANSKYAKQIAACEAQLAEFQQKYDEITNGMTVFEQYYNTAGEIEARDTENRLNLTAQERKNTRPNIDRKDVIFADNSKESNNLDENLGDQLYEWLNNNGKKGEKYNGVYFKLGTTPNVFVKHGAKQVEMIMYSDVVAKVTGMKGDDAHIIALDEIAKLPSQLNDPILLFKGSVPNSFIALTELVNKQGHDVVVAVHINRINGRSAVTKIASLYSKTNDYGQNRIVAFVNNQINNGNLLDASAKKAPKWFTTRGLQLPKVVQTIIDANNSITQNSDLSTVSSKKVEDGIKSSRKDLEKLDADYLSAVERGDMETAQRMVDEAAKKAGYTYKGMHGTDADFNNFNYSYIGDDNKLGLGFYFTNNEKLQFKYDYEKTAYLKINNPIYDNNPVLDDIIQREQELRESGLAQEETLKAIQKEFGYDGIIAEYNRKALVAFNPEQIKSADPVTYDDEGNVIPLSQRFNEENEDIRYSRKTVDPITSREALARALSKVAKGEDRAIVETYKANVNLIKGETERLNNLRKEIDEIKYKKSITYEGRELSVKEFEQIAYTRAEEMGIDAEKVKFKALKESGKYIATVDGKKILEANKRFRTKDDIDKLATLEHNYLATIKRISGYDKKLLQIEAMSSIKQLINREKKASYDKAKAEGKEALKEYKAKAIAEQKKITERYQEMRKKNVEGRKTTEMRHKLMNTVHTLDQLLVNPTKKKHIPIGLQKPVAEALNILNTDTVGAEERLAKITAELKTTDNPVEIKQLLERYNRIKAQGDKIKEKIDSLKAAYDKLLTSEDEIIRNSHDEVISNMIQNASEKIGDKAVRDMTYDELEMLYKMYRAILKTVRDANTSFKMEKGEEISTLGQSVMGELAGFERKNKEQIKLIADIKDGAEWYQWNNLKPIYAFKRIGSSTLETLYNNVRAGEDVWAVDMSEARAFSDAEKTKFGYSKWDMDKSYTFRTRSGKDFKLTLGQIMSIYAYSKRGEQAINHLVEGGFVYDGTTEIKKNVKGGVEVTYELKDSTAYRLSEEIIGQINATLTPAQKSFVDSMQNYLSTVMGEKGNEVSLALYDIKLFGEKNYFPLKSSQVFLERAREQARGEIKVKNKGFTKETTPKANNPIVLESFMDVWANHCVEMGMYHAFTLPLEDFYRVYNYKERATDEKDSESVIMHLENAFGNSATKYIDQLLVDINGGTRADPRINFSSRWIAKFKKAKTFLSASVVIQQPSAVTRAMALIDGKYFLEKPTNHKATWNEIKKYAPVAIIKEMGYFDTGMGLSSKDWLKNDPTKMEKVEEALSKVPAYADEIGWNIIWRAVKREIADTTDLKVNSEAFLQKCGERFTEVITMTQVYDSVFARSSLMRSKDGLAKMLTAFMAEPTTTINMLAYGLNQRVRGNKGVMKKFVGSCLTSAILNSMLVSIVYAARDDDEDEGYWEIVGKQTIDSVNIFKMMPFIKDMVSIFEGFTVSRTDVSLITDIYWAWQKLDNDNVSAYKKVEDFAGSIAAIFGVPLKNLMRDLRALWNFITSSIK